MPEAAEAILELHDVNLQFGEKRALHKISLSLTPGETYIILGAAGSGKTSLLKAVIGLIGIDTGQIRLFGDDVAEKSERELFALRSKVGFLFQEGGLFDSLEVGENVEYPLLNQVVSQIDDTQEEKLESKVRETLQFVELAQTYSQFPSELSGGMRRRVGIARAIVTNPALVLYDSPTAGLDPITANTIMAVIAKQRDIQNTASLIVTHRHQDGELMANFHYDPDRKELTPVTVDEKSDGARRTRFIVMKEGEIVFCGSLKELEASQDDYVKRFIKREE